MGGEQPIDRFAPTEYPVEETQIVTPKISGKGSGAAAAGELASVFPTEIIPQDLLKDEFLINAPRIEFNGGLVPALGGIPLASRLGKGGMGAVYRGFHRRLKKDVAVKVLISEQNPSMIERFFREAQLAASVKSPHLVSVQNVDREGGLCYLEMEFVRGVTADEYLELSKLGGASGVHETVALDICLAACTGLAVAHAEGIVHRDIKPANILIPKQRNSEDFAFKQAKLADLGLARRESVEPGVTASHACMGTAGFMAPEQIHDAQTCGKPADIFSFGATLYALLAGRAPFEGSSRFKIFAATIDAPHKPMRELRPEISALTAQVLDRCLAKNIADRYEDAAALLAALTWCRDALAEPEKTLLAVARIEKRAGSGDVGKTVLDANPLAIPNPQPASGHSVELKLTKSRGLSCVVQLSFAVLIVGCAVAALFVVDPFKPEFKSHEVTAVKPSPVVEPKADSRRREFQANFAEGERLLKEQHWDEARTAFQASRSFASDPLEQKRSDDAIQKVAQAESVEKTRLAALQADAKIAEARQTLALNMPEVFKAKDRGDWAEVVLLLKGPREIIGDADFANKTVVDNLLKQAPLEIEKRHKFDTALAQAQSLLIAKKYDEALNGFAQAREVWPQSARIEEVSAGEKEAGEALAVIRAQKAAYAAKVEAATAAAAREARYQAAMTDAKNMLALFEKQLVTQPDAEASAKTVLGIKPNDPDALAVLARISPPDELTLDLGHGATLELVLIKPGIFMMGSPATEKGRQPDEAQHPVRITQPFYMGKYLVTQAQYQAVTGSNPSSFIGPKNPVCAVSWHDAIEFCKQLNKQQKARLPAGMALQLPTEAQWEYACRAGTQTRFYSGDQDSDLPNIAWYVANSEGKTHPVGEKKANAFGLFDMHGNVWQWCQDAYMEHYENLAITDPFNAQGSKHVLRGDSWKASANDCRSAIRGSAASEDSLKLARIVGFRVAVSTPPLIKPQ